MGFQLGYATDKNKLAYKRSFGQFHLLELLTLLLSIPIPSFLNPKSKKESKMREICRALINV